MEMDGQRMMAGQPACATAVDALDTRERREAFSCFKSYRGKNRKLVVIK
jgi:hypothetical protein